MSADRSTSDGGTSSTTSWRPTESSEEFSDGGAGGAPMTSSRPRLSRSTAAAKPPPAPPTNKLPGLAVTKFDGMGGGTMRQCSVCHIAKELTACFFRDPSKPLGFDRQCKACKKRKTDARKALPPSINVSHRQCSICHETKERSEFIQDSRRATGLDARCKQCRRLQHQKRKLSNSMNTGNATVTEKSCRRCSQVKPAACFKRHAYTSSGLDSWCKDCCKQRRLEKLAKQGTPGPSAAPAARPSRSPGAPTTAPTVLAATRLPATACVALPDSWEQAGRPAGVGCAGPQVWLGPGGLQPTEGLAEQLLGDGLLTPAAERLDGPVVVPPTATHAAGCGVCKAATRMPHQPTQLGGRSANPAPAQRVACDAGEGWDECDSRVVVQVREGHQGGWAVITPGPRGHTCLQPEPNACDQVMGMAMPCNPSMAGPGQPVPQQVQPAPCPGHAGDMGHSLPMPSTPQSPAAAAALPLLPSFLLTSGLLLEDSFDGLLLQDSLPSWLGLGPGPGRPPPAPPPPPDPGRAGLSASRVPADPSLRGSQPGSEEAASPVGTPLKCDPQASLQLPLGPWLSWEMPSLGMAGLPTVLTNHPPGPPAAGAHAMPAPATSPWALQGSWAWAFVDQCITDELQALESSERPAAGSSLWTAMGAGGVDASAQPDAATTPARLALAASMPEPALCSALWTSLSGAGFVERLAQPLSWAAGGGTCDMGTGLKE